MLNFYTHSKSAPFHTIYNNNRPIFYINNGNSSVFIKGLQTSISSNKLNQIQSKMRRCAVLEKKKKNYYSFTSSRTISLFISSFFSLKGKKLKLQSFVQIEKLFKEGETKLLNVDI